MKEEKSYLWLFTTPLIITVILILCKITGLLYISYWVATFFIWFPILLVVFFELFLLFCIGCYVLFYLIKTLYDIR